MNPRRHQTQLRNLTNLLDLLPAAIAAAHQAADLTLPDGYPTGTGLDRVTGGGISNPVEGAVLERERITGSVEGEHEAHQVGFSAIETSLTVAYRALQEARTEASLICQRAEAGKVKVREKLAYCAACDRPAPRPRSGYCEACYQAWRRDAYSDRPAFERTRRNIHTETRAVVHIDRTRQAPASVALTVGAETIELPPDLAYQFAKLERPTPEQIREYQQLAITKAGS